MMQALVGGFCGLVAYFSAPDWHHADQQASLEHGTGGAAAETRRLIEQWGILHAGRSALALIATLIFP
jgi:hypothetical protein